MPLTLITVSHDVRRWTRQDCTGFQRLYREWRLFGRLKIWSRVIDSEDVPSWAFIQQACLGHTDWKSRLFKEYDHLLK